MASVSLEIVLLIWTIWSTIFVIGSTTKKFRARLKIYRLGG